MRIVYPGLGPGEGISSFASSMAWRLGGVRFEGSGGLTFLRLGPGGRLNLGWHPTVLS